ncbi:hypothetical protein [Cellulophaga baltica]|uniref:Uncharacterized protein n=1 Tax=Cellulophaga baltica TaxID=76594 RepID=A0A1G7M1W4_9FLAO|nr:hypothetical protein [Cellulophaga baltica]SDF55782.1 hypothetical protein SAMN04487992_1276 [Cellulophaga baltica]
MKLEIPNTFPDGMNDEEIQSVISKCAKKVTYVTKPDVNVSLGASYYISMIQLGQSELNNRIQSGLLDLIKNENQENKKSTFINRVLTGLTIALALITLYIGNKSLGFAESDQNSDEIWQTEQIELLKKQNQELEQLNKKLTERVKTDSIN